MMLHVWVMTHVIVTLDTMEHYVKVCVPKINHRITACTLFDEIFIIDNYMR